VSPKAGTMTRVRTRAPKRATYTVILDRETDGRVIASVPGFPGCHAYGRTPSAAVRKVRAALEFYLTELRCAGLEIPRQPHPVAVDIQVAV